MNGHQWEPITDLPDNWCILESGELASLASLWLGQRSRLASTDALRQFNERLCRQWAIETGIIEGLYDIDRGTTQLLIEHGLSEDLLAHGTTNRPGGEVIKILHDQQQALEGLFDFVSSRRQLSTSYIKEIHAALTQHQMHIDARDQFGHRVEAPILRGEWKRLPNNPMRPDGEVHEYCPPEQVASEMDRLIDIHGQHASGGVPPDVEAAWLHHRFTQIHPFQDGNGRVARSLASLIFMRANWFPLVITRDERAEYIQALEAADRGDLSVLVSLFARIEKGAFIDALSLSQEVLRGRETIDQLVAAIGDRLVSRRMTREQQREAEVRHAEDLAGALQRLAADEMRALAGRLHSPLQAADPHYGAQVDESDQASGHWFRYQVVETARRLGYFADVRSYSRWVRLRLREERQAEILLAFHSLGRDPIGLMAASAFLEYRDVSEDGETTIDGPHVLSASVFQFGHNEDEHAVKDRFRRWLDEVLVAGVDQWRRQL